MGLIAGRDAKAADLRGGNRLATYATLRSLELKAPACAPFGLSGGEIEHDADDDHNHRDDDERYGAFAFEEHGTHPPRRRPAGGMAAYAYDRRGRRQEFGGVHVLQSQGERHVR